MDPSLVDLTRRLKSSREVSYARGLVTRGLGISRQKFWQDLILTVGNDSVAALLGVISGILAARLLGPAGRCEMAAATVWAAMLGVIATLGLPHALTYSTARTPDDVGQIVNTMLVIWLLQSAIILVMGWLAVRLLLGGFQPTVANTVQVYLFSVPCSMLVTYLSTIAQGLKRFHLFNSLRFAASASYVVGLVLAGMLGRHEARDVIVVLLFLQIIVAMLALAVFWARIRPRGAFNRRQMTRLLKYGLKTYGGNISWLANGRLDQFIMSAVIASRELGLYAVAVSYATTPLFLSGSLANVLFPNIVETNRAHAIAKIRRMLKLSLALSGTSVMLLGLASPIVIPLVFGTDFRPAVYPALVLLGGTVLLGCNYILGNGLRGLGFPMTPSIAEAIALGVTVVGLAFSLPLYGIMGAAWVSVCSYAAAVITLMIRIKFILSDTSKME